MGSIGDLTEETLSQGNDLDQSLRLSQESSVSIGSATLSSDELSVTCSQQSTGELSLLNVTASDCSTDGDMLTHDALLEATYDGDCSETEDEIEFETWSDLDTAKDGTPDEEAGEIINCKNQCY